jgi:hypothetical protein
MMALETHAGFLVHETRAVPISTTD